MRVQQAFLVHLARKRRVVLINEFLSTKAPSCCKKDGVLVTVNADRTVTCPNCNTTCVVCVVAPIATVGYVFSENV